MLQFRRIVANRHAFGAALLALGLQVLAAGFPPLARMLHVAPLGLTDWLLVVALSAAPAVIGQGLKLLRGGLA